MLSRTPRARRLRAAAFAAALALAAPAGACDVCAVYTATDLQTRRTGPRLGVAEQFSYFATRKQGDRTVDGHGERLYSSITQLLLGWRFTDRIGAQLNLPIVARSYRRLESGRLADGDENGFGDLVVSADVLAFERQSEHGMLLVSLLGGLELPSGGTGPLAEEAAPAPVAPLAARRALRPRHAAHHGGHGGGPVSAIHGHDVSPGSGSVDGVMGASLFWSWDRAYLNVAGQYLARTRGAYDYRYADELLWRAGPGAYLLLDHRRTLSFEVLFSGETKGKDDVDGAPADDTAVTMLYLSPGFRLTVGTQLSAELAADIPVRQHVTSVQIVPDWRMRGGLVWRF